MLAETHDEEQRVSNAAEAARIAGSWGASSTLRAHAWKSLGRLRVYSPNVLRALDRVVPNSDEDEEVRRHAIWALGEIGRERPWIGGGKELNDVAIKGLKSALSRACALQLVEAIAKIYPQHSHSSEEAAETFMALNGLQAKFKEQLPGIYYTVLRSVADLQALADGLARILEVTKKDAGEEEKMRVYGAALALLRTIEDKQEPILANFDVQRARITHAFEALTQSLEYRERRLLLMVTWSLGRLASDPRLGRIVAGSIGDLLPSEDPALAFVSAWALSRFDGVTAGREAIREKILKSSVDAQVLRMVVVREGAEGLDRIQSLYGMSLEGQR
tara:strand:+ start:92 stop:1087 length:996 start_codon:yes stop_codon:yes gene_type:complete